MQDINGSPIPSPKDMPSVMMTDALSVIMTDGMSFGLGMGEPLMSCVIASLISILVWAVAIYLPDA